MTDVVMPKLSDSMETGAIVQWLVADGATVSAGDDIAEIETDKATMTHQSTVSGVIRLVANVDDELAVGDVIATIDGT